MGGIIAGAKTQDVLVQDPNTMPIDLYLCNTTGTTSPTVAMSVDETSVTVENTSGATVGDCLNITDNDRLFQSVVTDITGCIVSFSSPCDYEFSTDASVCFGEWDLSQVDGSANQVTYTICPPPGVKYDIYDMSISIEDNAVMYESKFGGITALNNGIVGRITDGYNKNIFLISNNSGFREYGFETEYPDKVPSGTYAFWADKSFRNTNGVAIRIDGSSGDTIQIIVQDALTGLNKMSVCVHGHVVGD